jgi:Uma2 family endonuclease
MVAIIADRLLEQRVRAERERTGADRYDEVWEGVYVMNPLPDNEHQRLVHRFEIVLGGVLEAGGLGQVFPGVNLTDRQEDWKSDFRCPDVVVFLTETSAENCGTHWRGPADLIIEIMSPDDRTREKLGFYSRLGVRELLIVNRNPWTLELYRWEHDMLRLAGQSTPARPAVLPSEVIPFEFRMASAEPHPRIEVAHVETGRQWLL